MPLFKKDCEEILFVHIPKSGGSSIEAFFKRQGYEMFFRNKGKLEGTSCSAQHFHAKMFEELFNGASFDYSFTIVRDPLERMFSEYRHRAKNNDGILWTRNTNH